MSWLGKLAGIGGLIAAPFTGGTSLSLLPAAFGGGDDSEGDGMDLSSLWGPDGTFLGDSSVAGEDDSSGSSGGGAWAKLLLKYGLPAAAGAIKSGQQSSQAQDQLQLLRDKLAEDTAARKQAAALEESKLDPFRGYMAQARDVGRLDMQAEGNFSSSPTQLDAKYGAGLNLQPEQFYTPSATMRGVARGARDAVARGDKVPTMTDPANYGKMPLVNFTGEANASAAPAGGPATAILAALRAKGLMADDDQPSPWLAQ